MEYFYLKFSAEFNELTLKFNWAPCISCPVTFPLVSTYSIRSKMYVNVRLMLQVTWSCRWRDATGDAMLQVTRCWIKIPFKSTQHENYVRCGKKMWDESLLWNNLSSSIIVFHATCSFFLFFFQILMFLPIQNFILHAISMLDEMWDWFPPVWTKHSLGVQEHLRTNEFDQICVSKLPFFKLNR